MAKLPIYQQQVETRGPTQQAQASGEALGIGASLQQAGQTVERVKDVFQRRMEQSDLSTATATLAKFHADKTVQWQDTLRKADPNDAEVANNFLKSYDEDFQKLKGSISSSGAQSYLDTQGTELRSRFQITTAAGQAELASVKAKSDYLTTQNSLSSVLVNDPSAYDSVKAMHDKAVDELVMSKGLPSDVALNLKAQGGSELAKSTVRGWIKLDPNHAIQELKSGRWDTALNGEQKFQLNTAAEVEIRGREAEAERQRAEDARLRKEQQQETQNGFLEKMQKRQLSVREVLDSNLDPVGSGSKQQFIDMIKESATRPIKTDPTVFKNLFERIHSPDGTKNKILDSAELNSYLGKGLDIESLNQLRKEIDDSRTPEGQSEIKLREGIVNIAKGRLTKSNPMSGITDPVGDEQFQRFMVQFTKDFREGRKAGKSAVELTDPDSPHYLGKLVTRFVRSPEQQMNDLVRMSQYGSTDGGLASTPDAPAAPAATPAGATPAPTPAAPNDKARKPGETVAQWMARTKGTN